MKNLFKLTKRMSLLAAILFAFGCGSGGGSSTSTTNTGDNTNTDTTAVDASLRAISSGDLDLILTGVASSGKKGKKSRKARESLDSNSFGDSKCILFIALLSDKSYSDLIGIVKTDAEGKFEITAEDVFDYLKAHTADVEEDSTFATLDPKLSVNRDRILAAFKKLGALRQTAFYKDGDAIISMEFLQDVSNIDPNLQEKSDPRDRILFHWVEKIFEDLGIVPTEKQFAELKDQIEALSKEILNQFQLPEGVTAEEFAISFKNENTLVLTDEKKALIEACLLSTEPLSAAEKENLKAAASAPHQTISDPLANELNQDLTGLINNLGNEIQKRIEDALNDSASTSAFKILLSTEGVKLNVDDDTFKTTFDFETKRKESLMRFFVSLGFPVVVEADPADKDPLIVMAMLMPASVSEEFLPGSKFFGDRNIRAFRISDLDAMVTDANALFTNQAAVGSIATQPIDSLSEADFIKLEKLKIVHEFARIIKHGPPLVSYELICQIAATTKKVELNTVASVITEHFEWRKNSVILFDDGGNTIPLFTKGTVPPEGGSSVNATVITRKLTIKLSATPLEAVNNLTSTDSFIFQYLPQAIEEGFQRSHSSGVEFKFPATIEEAKQLVLQSFHFRGIRNGIGRGLIAAFPPPSNSDSLYGTLLSGETKLNAKSAIFFVNFLLNSQFLIDSSKGFVDTATIIPNFDNIKFLEVKDPANFSLAKLVSSLLNLTEFSESSKFASAVDTLGNLCNPTGKFANLLKLPEFNNDIPDDINKKANVTVEMEIEFFDKRTIADITTQVSAKAVAVTFGPNGPEETGDTPIAGTITATDGNNNQWKVSFPAVPSDKEYFVFIQVEGYQNQLPEFFFFADGFGDPLNITAQQAFVIPPDENFGAVPCAGLVANQQAQDSAAGDLEGIDFSNFDQGLPFIFPASKDGTDGKLDIRFALNGNNYSLETTFSGITANALIAPLHVDWSGTEPVVSLAAGNTTERLTDPHSAAGLNFLTLINSITDADMSTSQSLTSNSSVDVDNFFKNGPPLFLLKDRQNIYWVISVEYIDAAFAPGFIDLCFAKIGQDGKLDLPEINLEQDVDLNGTNPCIFLGLFYGDHALFPVKADGSLDITRWEWSAPEEAPFGFNSAVAASAQIRYAGESFKLKAGTKTTEELQALEDFFIAGDFSTVPSRLDYYGPDGGGLAVISYNSDTKSWPAISTASYDSYVSSLKRGDMVLLRQKNTGDPDLICFVEKDSGDASFANASIGLIVANYNDPSIHTAGVLVDADSDGYIAKFDPNDNDANIIPDGPPGGEEFKDEDASSFAGGSPVTGIFAQNGAQKVIFLDINEFMEEVYQMTLTITVKSKAGVVSPFPSTGEKIIVEITPPDFSDPNNTNYEPTAILNLGSSIKIDGVSTGHMNMEFITANSQFDANGLFEPGAKIMFEFEFKFRPRDPATGMLITDVTKFGENPVRPTLTGFSELPIPELADQVGAIDEATVIIQQGADQPETLANGIRLEPQKDIFISWVEVLNADFYEFEIDVPDIETPEGFLPGYHERFVADNTKLKITIPAFRLPPGRSGIRITFIARRNNVFGEPTNDGTFIEYSSLSTSGDAEVGAPGGFNNSEVKLATGDKLYFHADTGIVDANPTGGVELFSVILNGTTVDITLAANISGDGHLDGFDGGAVKKSLKKQLSSAFAAGSTFTAKLDSFFTLFGITLPDGAQQPIDIQIGGFIDNDVKMFTFLPPPFRDISSGGDYDVNGDATNDVNFNGGSILNFNAGIEVSRFDPNLGPIVLSTTGQATIYTIPAGVLKVDFDLEFSDGKRYWFFIDLEFNSLEFGEIIGGANDPTSGGDIFAGELGINESLEFDNVNFLFFSNPSSTASSVFDFNGTTASFINGWKIRTDDGTGPVEATSITLITDQSQIMELFNDSLNLHFDLDLILFQTGSLGTRVLQAGGGSTGGGNQGPYDPFADPNITFAYEGSIPSGNFFEAIQGDPVYTFNVAVALGGDAIFNFINGEITPVNGWNVQDEFGNAVGSVFPTADFAQFIKFEDPTSGKVMDGYVIMEGANLKMGIFGVFGGGGGNPPPNGIFDGVLLANDYLNIQEISIDNYQFAITTVLGSTIQDMTLFKFVTSTNEVSPENGWIMEIMTQSGPVAAPTPLIATTTITALKLTNPNDTKEIFLDISIENLNLNVHVVDIIFGPNDPNDPNNPPSTEIFKAVLNDNEYFNYDPLLDPTTFSITAATVDLTSQQSILKWDGSKVTSENGWEIYDPTLTLVNDITPNTVATTIRVKNINATDEFDLDIYLDANSLTIDVIGIIPAGNNPPPSNNLFDALLLAGDYLDYFKGPPATFGTNNVLISLSNQESMFKWDGAKVLPENGWEMLDANANNILDYTPTASISIFRFKKVGAPDEMDIELSINNVDLEVGVVATFPAGNSTNIFDITMNSAHHFNVIFGGPDTYNITPTVQVGPEESMFLFGSTDITAVNGWEFQDDLGNPLPSPVAVSAVVSHIKVLRPGDDEYLIEVTLNGAQLDVSVVEVLAGLPPPTPIFDAVVDGAARFFNIDFNNTPETAFTTATLEDGVLNINTETAFEFDKPNSKIILKNGWKINGGSGDLPDFIIPAKNIIHNFQLKNIDDSIIFNLEVSILNDDNLKVKLSK